MPWNPPGRREPVPCPPPKRQVPAVPHGPQSFPTSPWGKGPVSGSPGAELTRAGNVVIQGTLFTPKNVPMGAISYLVTLPMAG